MTTQQRGPDLWARISAPITEHIQFRQKSKPLAANGKYWSLYVAYIEAETVRKRLDEVVPGEWDLHLELMPALPAGVKTEDGAVAFFKARLQILGVIREDVGQGKDYKQASTDAFKRVAVRFGIGSEMYAMPKVYVQMDGDGKYAKPVEPIETAVVRAYRRAKLPLPEAFTHAAAPASPAPAGGSVSMPKPGPVAGAITPAAGVSQGQEQAPPAASRRAAAKKGANRPDPEPVVRWKTLPPEADAGTTAKAYPDLPHAKFLMGVDYCLPACPTCGSPMTDQRLKKKPFGPYSNRAPDFVCTDRDCADHQEGKYWTNEFQTLFARGALESLYISRGEGGAMVLYFPEDRITDDGDTDEEAGDDDDDDELSIGDDYEG